MNDLQDFRKMMGIIDRAYVECPLCGKSMKVEWARRKNMMPPKSYYCNRCKQSSEWEDLYFITYEQYAGLEDPRYWEYTKHEDRTTE